MYNVAIIIIFCAYIQARIIISVALHLGITWQYNFLLAFIPFPPPKTHILQINHHVFPTATAILLPFICFTIHCHLLQSFLFIRLSREIQNTHPQTVLKRLATKTQNVNVKKSHYILTEGRMEGVTIDGKTQIDAIYFRTNLKMHVAVKEGKLDPFLHSQVHISWWYLPPPLFNHQVLHQE